MSYGRNHRNPIFCQNTRGEVMKWSWRLPKHQALGPFPASMLRKRGGLLVTFLSG